MAQFTKDDKRRNNFRRCNNKTARDRYGEFKIFFCAVL